MSTHVVVDAGSSVFIRFPRQLYKGQNTAVVCTWFCSSAVERRRGQTPCSDQDLHQINIRSAALLTVSTSTLQIAHQYSLQRIRFFQMVVMENG